MSCALQTVLTSIRQNDYGTVAILSAVGYDYVLTLLSELEYIWSKPWTWASTLFIFVRYFGLCNLIISAYGGSSFLPGRPKMYVLFLLSVDTFQHIWYNRTARVFLTGEAIYIFSSWEFLFFLGAADFVLTLRVWTMYDRSKLILGPLAVLYSLVMISCILTAAINSDPKYLSVTTVQVLDFSFCNVTPTSPISAEVTSTLQLTLGAVMCILAIVHFVRKSLQIYRVQEQWQLNQYMNLLVQQGILYFIAVFLFSLINALAIWGALPASGWQVILLFILEIVPMYTLAPRFILSTRKRYIHVVQDSPEGGIDSAPGPSLSDHEAGGIQDVEQNEEPTREPEGDEEPPTEGETAEPEQMDTVEDTKDVIEP